MTEREQRANYYENLLARDEDLIKEVGEADQQLEILTLMKYGVDKYESVLTPRELDVIAAAFHELVQRSGLITGVVPNWFVESLPDNAQNSYVQNGGEACLRQATVLASLNHPNVRKFYGACHVGRAFISHEKSQLGPPKWHFSFGCALGLAYMHRHGFVCRNLNHKTLSFGEGGKRGMLTGLDAERVGNRKLDCVNVKGTHRLILTDMTAFGRVIFEILARSRGNAGIHSHMGLPMTKPDFLNASEWNLFHVLRNAKSDGGYMNDVVEKMKKLSKQEKTQNQQNTIVYESNSDWLSKVGVELEKQRLDIETYFIAIANMTISEALNKTGEALKVAEVKADGQYKTCFKNCCEYKRIIDLKEQFVAYFGSLPASLVDMYAMNVWSLHEMLDVINDEFKSASASLQNSVMMANELYTLQMQLDETIANSGNIVRSSEIHCWRSAYQSHDSFNSLTTNSVISLNCVDGVPRDRSTLIIPMEEVQRKEKIDRGAFGSVHCTEWLGTSVVIKEVETIQEQKAYWDQFFQEAELWLRLNRSHLIHLYGVNYAKQRPFFVCERATDGTLIRFLEKVDRTRLVDCLIEAALGLEYFTARELPTAI